MKLDQRLHTWTSMLPTGGGKIFGPKKFSGVGENFFANLGVGDGLFEPKGGVKRILLKGELKIFQQRGAKLPLGHTLNWGVQMKKISFGGGKKNFSYGILNTCPRMTLSRKICDTFQVSIATKEA